jgi:hypothetical protein
VHDARQSERVGRGIADGVVLFLDEDGAQTPCW